MIEKGDIVKFKRIYKIGIDDLIARKNYSKYMVVIDIIEQSNTSSACKVLCSNGDVNWVSIDRIERAD